MDHAQEPDLYFCSEQFFNPGFCLQQILLEYMLATFTNGVSSSHARALEWVRVATFITALAILIAAIVRANSERRFGRRLADAEGAIEKLQANIKKL
jgi:hypothetical protein